MDVEINVFFSNLIVCKCSVNKSKINILTFLLMKKKYVYVVNKAYFFIIKFYVKLNDHYIIY